MAQNNCKTARGGRMGLKDNSAYSGDRRYQPVRRNRKTGISLLELCHESAYVGEGGHTYYRQPFKDN